MPVTGVDPPRPKAAAGGDRIAGFAGSLLLFVFLQVYGNWIVATLAPPVLVWDLDQGSCIRKFKGHPRGQVRSVALSADGRHALSGGDDGQVRLWAIL